MTGTCSLCSRAATPEGLELTATGIKKMIDKFLTKVFGSSNQRYLKTLLPLVERINSLEPEVKKLSDEQMRARIGELREQVVARVGDTNGKGEEVVKERKRRTQEALDEILPEVF